MIWKSHYDRPYKFNVPLQYCNYSNKNTKLESDSYDGQNSALTIWESKAISHDCIDRTRLTRPLPSSTLEHPLPPTCMCDQIREWARCATSIMSCREESVTQHSVLCLMFVYMNSTHRLSLHGVTTQNALVNDRTGKVPFRPTVRGWSDKSCETWNYTTIHYKTLYCRSWTIMHN